MEERSRELDLELGYKVSKNIFQFKNLDTRTRTLIYKFF